MLAGCQTGPLGQRGDATRAASADSGVQLIERDIEAPEVFQTQDRALWDGRPSLGGVWVASPGVTDPERVIIRNGANGKFVIGALFRRERDNPGPALQLSSDAAAALGILAGAPTVIDVVALRREELPDPVAAPATQMPQDVAPLADTGDQIPQAAAAPDAAAPGKAQAMVSEPTVAPRRGNWLQRAFDSQERTFRHIIVTPAITASDRAAVPRTARSLGLDDAFAVAG